MKIWIKLIEKLKYYILDLAIKYIRYYSKDSNYISHANTEYSIAWPNYKEDRIQSYMCSQVNDLLALLSTQGDSGMSINYKLSLLKKLITFNTISPLTFKDDEFRDNGLGSFQNIRNSKVFKNKNNYSYLDGSVKHGKYYIGEKNEIIERDGGRWSGGCFVIPKEDDIYYKTGTDFIRNTKSFNGESFIIPTYEIEYSKGWWLSCCKEDDLKEYFEKYYIKKDYEHLNKELNYKGGIYAEEIKTKLRIIKQHMYK